ncbi:hypothetical protein TNCV_1667581 [Trichonephila clavipes]|nr:hypothetical protein TNCV_1667581 [Trichonephila clavipes]
MASTTDEHREITTLLKSKGEEFYVVPALADRPLKVVIKGLPKSTATADIKADLLEQGVPVMKVSQLTQRKSKFPLPHLLVEELRPKIGIRSPKKPSPQKANANLSYANAASNSQQMAAPTERNEPAKNSSSKSVSNKEEENSSPQGFISAMAEFRKFFQDFPGIIDAGEGL